MINSTQTGIGISDNMMMMIFMTVATPLSATLIATITKLITEAVPNTIAYIKQRMAKQKYSVTISKTTYFKSDRWITKPGDEYNQDLMNSILHFATESTVPNDIKCSILSNEPDDATKTQFQKSIPLSSFKYKEFIISFTQNETSSDKDGRSITTLLMVSSEIETVKIREFIFQCYADYNIKFASKIVVNLYLFKQIPSVHGLSFNRYILKNNKTMDSLFFPDKSKLIEMADKLITGELSKLSFMLHGLPGTGKTSIIKALANYMNYDVIEAKLSYMMNDTDIINLFHNDNLNCRSANNPDGQSHLWKSSLNRRIYILEDVDADSKIVHKRTEELEPLININDDDHTIVKKKYYDKMMAKSMFKGLTLSGILNALDGVLEINGSVVIITTNHPEKLDPAFYRAGRITMSINLKKITPEDANKMILHEFNDTIDDFPDDKFTPAELESLCQIATNIDELRKMVFID